MATSADFNSLTRFNAWGGYLHVNKDRSVLEQTSARMFKSSLRKLCSVAENILAHGEIRNESAGHIRALTNSLTKVIERIQQKRQQGLWHKFYYCISFRCCKIRRLWRLIHQLEEIAADNEALPNQYKYYKRQVEGDTKEGREKENAPPSPTQRALHLLRAIDCLENNKKNKHYHKVTISAALLFLKKTFVRFSENNHTPIPGWYHATKEISSIKKIFSQSVLKQYSKGSVGKGTYVSTTDEYRRYGSYTIAYDAAFIEKQNNVTYFTPPRDVTMSGNRIWLKIQNNLLTNQQTVAAVITETSHVRDLEDALRGKNITVLDRPTASLIQEVLEKTLKKRYKPPQWEKSTEPSLNCSPFPKNAQHFSGLTLKHELVHFVQRRTYRSETVS